MIVVLCGCIKDNRKGAALQVGDSLADFEVVMNDVTVVTDDILKESVSVVMFFSTVCKDCRQVLPQMQKIYDEYLSQGVRFALVSRAESESSIISFWGENGLKMPYSAQNDRHIYELFAKERIPRVYICDKDGIIRYIFTDDPIPVYDDLMSSLDDGERWCRHYQCGFECGSGADVAVYQGYP